MPVEIKHITRITWNDIPAIENPFFARSAIAHACSAAPSWGVFSILGLDGALGDYARWYSPYGPQTELNDALAWLLDRVDAGEYVLIRSDDNWTAPMDSVLRWATESGGLRMSCPSDEASGGRWKADPRLPMLMRLEIDECLEKARRGNAPECRKPERLWWGGVVDGRIWKDGKEAAPKIEKPAPPSAKKPSPAKEKPPFELKLKVTEFTWGSSIAAAREDQRIPPGKPHWEEKTSATIPEEGNAEIQHYSSGSKKPGVYLIKGKGEDRATVKIEIHLVDPEGELTGKKYKVRCNLGGLPMQSTESFVMASGTKALTMKLDLPSTLKHFEGDATFEAIPDGHGRGTESIENTPRLEAFVIYDKPMAFYKKGVWVEALRLVFKKAGVAGTNEPKSISAKVTSYCHSGHRMAYDTGGGASFFIKTDGHPGLGGSFTLKNYISGKNDKKSNLLNCYDSAGAVQTLCGALGVKVQWIFQEPFGFINPTNLIGVGQCNNPFFTHPRFTNKPLTNPDDPRRSKFGNHAFVAAIPSDHAICDACAGPHIGDENLVQYLKASIDFSVEFEEYLAKKKTTATDTQKRLFIDSKFYDLLKGANFKEGITGVTW
jgi:hypothetical protein